MCRKIPLFALIAFVICAVNAAEAQDFVTDGLVSFWTFDSSTVAGDRVHDVWGSNNGTAVDVEIVPGQINEGLEFNGSSSLVDIDDDPSLDITDAISIEAWINIRSWELDPNRNVIMARYVAGAGQRYMQFSLNPDNGLATYMGYAGGTAYFQTQKGGQNTDWVGRWVHVACAWDYSDGGLCKLYVDGKEINSYVNQEPLEEPLIPYPIPWTIGAMADTNRFFAGIIDEVRIYKKRLSDAEVMRNFEVTSNSIAVQPAGKLAAVWGEVKTQ